MTFFNRIRLSAIDFLDQTVDYIQAKYNISKGTQFTPSSPWFHILIAVSNLAELIIEYLTLAQEENNIKTAQQSTSIAGLASLTGHECFRGKSARARVELSLNPEINFRSVEIDNNSLIMCNETGSQFFCNIPKQKIVLSINNGDNAVIELVQGTRKEVDFVGDGTINQAYNPSVKSMTDHEMIEVYVNGVKWRKSDSFYDMNRNEMAYIVKTSPNMGFVVMFGNGHFGGIPSSGSNIKIKYVETSGQDGNANIDVTWKWLSVGHTPSGEVVDLNENIGTRTVDTPMLGCDFEDLDSTRMIAPMTSKSMLLATADNFKHYLSRYDDYKVIKVWTTESDLYVQDDNIVYIKMIPKIQYRLKNNQDYFSYTDNFVMTEKEKQRFYDMLEESGKLLIGTEPVIFDVNVRKFAIVIRFRYFDDVTESVAKLDIRKALSNYFMNFNRTDYIPVSDIVGVIENLNSIDSCTVSFVTEDNEKAKTNKEYKKKVLVWNAETMRYDQVERVVKIDSDVENPNIGMNDAGDIIIGEDDLWVCRGGWTTANNITLYETQLSNDVFGPLLMVASEKISRNKV